MLLSNVHFGEHHNHYKIYYGTLSGDLYLCKNSKADLNGKKFMFNTVLFCLHDIPLNGEISVNSEVTVFRVFRFPLCKLKLVVFLPIFK